MAQNISLLGADYSAVPAVLLPKTGGGTARFDDCSVTTAAAADVASGKVFVSADGAITTGTNSGGGAVKVGVIRPDAELVKTWSNDFYAVADDGLTIPSYSTSATTLKASTNLEVLTVVPGSYAYFINERVLTIPEYNITTKAKGRCDHSYAVGVYELIYQPSGVIQSLDATHTYGQYSQMLAVGSCVRYVYWSSATAISVYTSAAYGANQGVTAPAIASNTSLTIKSPTLTLRGHTTYLTNTFYDALTDIRCQYVIELWRVPITDVNGWEARSTMYLCNDCAHSDGHKLI